MSSTDNPSELLFQGNAEFLRELFKDSPCDRKSHDIVPPTGPITCSQTLNALHNFCETFRGGWRFNYFPTKIKMDSFLESLFLTLKHNNEGLGFHYGYDAIKREIVYILSKGKITEILNSAGDIIENEVNYSAFTGNEIPNAQGPVYLVLLSNNVESYDKIDEMDFQDLKANYFNYMRRKIGPDLIELDVDNEPNWVYHNPAAFLEFYYTYKAQYNPYLYIAHGAIKPEKAVTLYHAPCFIFGDRTRFFLLDNTDHSTSSGDNKFKNKALDIGRLCPPHCREPLTSSPD